MGVAFDMTLFLVRRMAGFAATLFIATLVIFLLLDLLPGDPARFILGINATPEAVAALRTQMGLDAPAHERFLAWVGGMLVGDFGLSTTQRLPVAELIAERMAVTLPLSLIAMVVSVVVGLPIGILAAMRRGKATDTALMVLAQTGLAIPNFWFGMLLTLVFAVTLRWLPTGGFIPWDEDAGAAMRGMILPGLALALPQASILARVMRTALVDVTEQDFIRTARAKGASEARVILRHALKGGLLPVVSFLGPALAGIISGSFVIETIFQIPGLGREFVNSAFNRDYTLVTGTVILYAVLIITFNLLVDIAVVWLNPKLRLE